MAGWDNEFEPDRVRREPDVPADPHPPGEPRPPDAYRGNGPGPPPSGGDRDRDRYRRPPRRQGQGQRPQGQGQRPQGQGQRPQGQGHGPPQGQRPQGQGHGPPQGQGHGPPQGQGHGPPQSYGGNGHGHRPGWEGPAGIAQKLARDFPDGVRSRGQSYFAKNRVAITAASPGEVVARVRGTAKYRVRLRLRGEKLVATCSCPYFSPFGDPCKHVWATILAVDARGLLPSAPMRPLRLVTDVPPAKRAPHGGAPDPNLGPLILPLPTDSPGNGPLPPSRDPNHNYHRDVRHPSGPPPRRPPSPAPYRPGGYGPNPGGYGPNPASGPGPVQGPGPGPGQIGPSGARGRNRKEKDRRPRGPGLPVDPLAQGPPRPYLPHLPQGQIQSRDRRVAKPVKMVRNTKRMLAYILDIPATIATNQVVIELARRLRKPNGDWSELKLWRHSGTPTLAQHRYDPEDEELLALLSTASVKPVPGPNGQPDLQGTSRFTLLPDRQAEVVENLARTERLRLRRAGGEEKPPTLKWVPAPWRFGIDVKADPSGKRWTWRGILRRRVNGEEQKMDLGEPLALLNGLVILGNGRAAPFDDAGIFLWMMRIRHEKEMVFNDAAEQDEKLERILTDARVSPDSLIDTLELRVLDVKPRPSLTLRTPRQNWGSDKLLAEIAFDYEDVRVPLIQPPGRYAVRTEQGLTALRDNPFEQEAMMLLFNLGFKDSKDHLLDPGTMELPAKRMPQVTKELVALGWKVEAEGAIIHPAGEFKLNVTTGIDWFELGGAVDFGGQSVALPDLLAAARRGETMVELGDGSMGMLPEEWLKKYGLLADLGSVEDGGIRFGKAQAGLLDALLAAQPEISIDMAFGKVRQALPRFEGLQPRDAPAGFRGELRPYQCEGLGWLDYLQKFEFGGILADDMGLGKTVQVLAHLQSRRARRLSRGPSLIVVPRSLVFNWIQEAERFTPRLRVLDYTGSGRQAVRETFDDHDLIITTYGTLRTDIADLCQVKFEYVILDEAQAIKNADSQSAKAARLLKGRHRLAMTGTPIENHLGELWSIFEFLNPGMLGTAGVFKRHTSGGSAADEGSRSLLARALRPFILRRTKAQVVQDLPEKVEQTLQCDMEPAQRQLYEELRAHYRQALLRKDAADLNRSKIEVLEALLRLRQASCHPGLIDPARSGDPSAKLDMLLPQLAEVVEEGHKVLIFSQFTKFLGLVRDRLDAEGITYEYLDGRTRNRAERVERFQNDPSVPVFLISLKAGGLGLNLTAAGYVYLLDPWWNPAVEAQAIDRSHRIGQTQQVFAYRLICRDTVEQKILELQQKKRDLADAILNADNQGVMASLTRDDLEFLLS
jgi:superfamily II DNA or RNA helicase